MPTSGLYEHTFTWSLPLARVGGTERWEACARLRWGETVVYKFVVNDHEWVTSPTAPTECDESRNVNNVLSVPSLALPPVTPEALDDLALQAENLEGKEWRTVRLAHWTGSSFSLFAATTPSHSLTFRTLRTALLPALLESTSTLPGSFCFARLPGMEVVGEEKEGEVGEGTYVLVGAEPVLPLSFKSFSLLPAPSSFPSLPPSSSRNLSTVAADEEDQPPTPLESTTILTPSSLSRLPRSTTRYFDFDASFSSSDDGGYAASEAGTGYGGYSASASEFSDLEIAPGESRSRSASFARHVADDEEDDGENGDVDMDADARSDATFNTALSQGWISSVGGGGGGGVAAASVSGGESGGWTSGGLPATSSSGADESASSEGTEEGSDRPVGRGAANDADGEEGPRGVRVWELVEGVEDGMEEEVEKAWDEGKVAFLPLENDSSLLPFALHPSALPLAPLLRPSSALLHSLSAAPQSSLAKKETDDAEMAQLPTPPASPLRKDGLPLPSALALSSFAPPELAGEELVEEVSKQAERGVGRWVAVGLSA
ncbi:hypothetical protein JCM6882_002218 [Rhodosporidiobolus microsporus]